MNHRVDKRDPILRLLSPINPEFLQDLDEWRHLKEETQELVDLHGPRYVRANREILLWQWTLVR